MRLNIDQPAKGRKLCRLSNLDYLHSCSSTLWPVVSHTMQREHQRVLSRAGHQLGCMKLSGPRHESCQHGQWLHRLKCVCPVQGSTVTASQETDTQHFINALQKIENSAGRYSPGSLLMAQDPNDLNRCNLSNLLVMPITSALDGYLSLPGFHGSLARCPLYANVPLRVPSFSCLGRSSFFVAKSFCTTCTHDCAGTGQWW